MNIILIPFSLYIYYIEDFWNALLCNSKHVKRIYLSYLVISWSFVECTKSNQKKKKLSMKNKSCSWNNTKKIQIEIDIKISAQILCYKWRQFYLNLLLEGHNISETYNIYSSIINLLIFDLRQRFSVFFSHTLLSISGSTAYCNHTREYR